ncbi:MAG: hypothetical protein H6841_07135 [Planctomycetes bacterium]|nr:hypothetical protein [Planctomycetota bacterium]MCB9935757.1 hypothetical protein [Planctomycetota bacterium]
MSKRGQQPEPDEGEILREIATRKIEAERLRVRQLAEDNEKMRTLAADLQRKISVANARVAELEKKLKLSLTEKDKEFKGELKEERDRLLAEIKDLKEGHKLELQRERDRWEKKLNDLDARHAKDLERATQKGAREIEKLAGVTDSVGQQLEDLREELEQERQIRQAAEARLKALDTTAKRIGIRSGQLTGFEVDSPEELLEVLGEVDAELPLKVMRDAVRELRSAAANVERAFAQAVKTDDARQELHDAGVNFAAARELPDTDRLPPAPAMLVEEAFALVSEEVADRIKGRHYSTLVSAMANELVRVLRNQREDLGKLQRLVEIAEGTELATSARLLLKGATGHQQEIAAAKLIAEELRQVQAEAREQKGKVKKLYASAESGMAGEWAVEAMQALAQLKKLPAPDREAVKRPLYHRVVEGARLVQERIDSAVNLGAEAEAAVREADESFSALEGLVAAAQELLVAARRELMSKVQGEQDVRLRIQAARTALMELGKRGKRAAAIFDEQMKGLDMLLNQWKATYQAYSGLSRDMDRIETSIEGSMLDLNQPLESETGKRLYQIIHDLSEHLPEFRSINVMRQRLFFHLENPKQRIFELKQVREAAERVLRQLGNVAPNDHTANWQLVMARLYDIWAYLEEVRGGTHSQLAVAAEQIEPQMADVMVWISSSNVDLLTDAERDEVMYTTAYVRKLKRAVLGIHDLAQQSGGSEAVLTAQFEHRLDTLLFPLEWQHVVARVDGSYEEADVNPPTEREPRR